jgi:hypothetical protein
LKIKIKLQKEIEIERKRMAAEKLRELKQKEISSVLKTVIALVRNPPMAIYQFRSLVYFIYLRTTWIGNQSTVDTLNCAVPLKVIKVVRQLR